MKTKLNKQEKEKLDSKIVFLSSIIILYALLLLFIQRMSMFSITVNGAIAFVEILRWASLAGAMACAAWSAYKEKKGFFLYCVVCIFVFLSTTVLLFCTKRSSNAAYLLNYGALIAAFVMTQVYYVLKSSNRFQNKIAKNIFIALCAIMVLALAVVCILQAI